MTPLNTLAAGETVAAAWAESCSGPGWSNTLIWYLVREVQGGYRVEAIQPRQQTALMLTLFPVADAVQRSLTAEVTRWLAKHAEVTE